jgi:signal transduction histidine kinase/CheY-like chemotaxis protein
MTWPTVENDRRKRRRWIGRLSIIASAALAGAVLFDVFLRLATAGQSTLAGVVLLLGTAAIVAASLYLWHQESAQRILRLMRTIRSAEQERDQANADMEDKARMLATMSHEIRTPLNGVIGMLNLLMHTELSPEQKNYAKTAQVSGRTLLSIVDEILDTSKAEAQRSDKALPVDLLAIVESATELLAPRAHAKAIGISAYVTPDVPGQVIIDDLKLRQILFNIAGNAIKFTQHGGVDISLSRQATTLVMTIADTGIGMDDVEIEKLFTEYAQANDAIARKFGGTGLGLIITKRIVEQMNGTIMVQSRKGEGTTFTIMLPNLLPIDVPQVRRSLEGRKFALALTPGVNTLHLRQSLVDMGAVVQTIRTDDLRAFLSGPSTDTVVISDTSHALSLRAWAQSIKRSSRDHHQVWIMLTAEERSTHQDLMGGPYAGYLLKPLRRSTLLARLTAYDDAMVATAARQLRDVHKGRRTRALQILVAEDNPVNMLLLTTLLVKMGHQVQEVDHGVEALRRLVAPNNFDLAIVDVQMPGLSGLEVARRLRAHEKDWGSPKSLPLLALTGNARTKDREACLAAGMTAHLAKPFDQHDLKEAIEKLAASKVA